MRTADTETSGGTISSDHLVAEALMTADVDVTFRLGGGRIWTGRPGSPGRQRGGHRGRGTIRPGTVGLNDPRVHALILGYRHTIVAPPTAR